MAGGQPMMRQTLRLAAVLLAVLCLSGCMTRAQSLAQRATPAPTVTPAPTPSPTPGCGLGGWAPERTADQQKYGSAGLLAWPCILFSLYLDEPEGGAVWTDEEIAQSQQTLAVAVDWIETQASAYGASPKLYYGSQDLIAHLTYQAPFAGGTEADEGPTFREEIEQLCTRLDSDKLAETYGTTNIGFLVFLPVAGCSFTAVHFLEDGSTYYHEYSCLYKENVFFPEGSLESPTVYAHEILHQFGAPDLYAGSNDLYVTDELVDYVAETWPDAIMMDTYDTDGELQYGAIDKSLCPLTAYRLGLTATFPGIEQFPEVAVDPPGTFRLDPDTDVSRWQDGALAAAPAA